MHVLDMHIVLIYNCMSRIIAFYLLVCSWTCLAVEYAMKLPVPSTAKVEEANGIITIYTTFKPSRAFNAQFNRKVDLKHAERICREALRRFFEVGQGSITYSGMQSVGVPVYSNGLAQYAFSVPKKGVKVIPRKSGDNTNASSQQRSVPQGQAAEPCEMNMPPEMTASPASLRN